MSRILAYGYIDAQQAALAYDDALNLHDAREVRLRGLVLVVRRLFGEPEIRTRWVATGADEDARRTLYQAVDRIPQETSTLPDSTLDPREEGRRRGQMASANRAVLLIMADELDSRRFADAMDFHGGTLLFCDELPVPTGHRCAREVHELEGGGSIFDLSPAAGDSQEPALVDSRRPRTQEWWQGAKGSDVSVELEETGPIDYLVVPRYIATVIMTMVLAVVGSAIMYGAGGLTAYLSFGVNPRVFYDLAMVEPRHVVLGLLKAFCYGGAIPIVSGFCGLRAHGSSEGVGWATTAAVVGSSFAVLAIDFFLSVGALWLIGGDV